MENSKIEWTDHTFNPWIGCRKIAAGCTHCYAEAFAKRYGKATWGDPGVGTRVSTSAAYWRKPLAWDRQARHDGVRRRVFCASMADVFEDWGGPVTAADGDILWRPRENGEGHRPVSLDDMRQTLFDLIDETPNLDWLLLTKRPESVLRMWPAVDGRCEMRDAHGKLMNPEGHRRENVWIGTSISDQTTAIDNVPMLMRLRALAPVLFLSAEPLLGPITLQDGNFHTWLGSGTHDPYGAVPYVNWLIVGGESGPGARPMEVEWVRSLRHQCVSAGVPFFFKQWGGLRPKADPRGRKLDGREWNQFPDPALAGV